MARISLVHLAVERVKQRRKGSSLLIPPRKNKEIVMVLREIAAGAVTFENIHELPKLKDEQASDSPEHEDKEKQTAKEAA